MRSEWILVACLVFVEFREGYAAEKPVIGIVAMELHPHLQLERAYLAYSAYFPASYAKAVESSGARVVPIISGRSESYYRLVIGSGAYLF